MGKRLRKSQIKRNIPIFAAVVLFCLTLFSVYPVTGLYARYATSVQSSDQARVAKFSIKFAIKEGSGTISQPITAELVPGGSQTVYLEIKNDSEVAVGYTVEVTNVTKNLPLSFRMVKGTNSTAPEVHANEDYTEFTAQQVPGSHTDEYMLVIDWPAPEDKDHDPDTMGMVDYITVAVTAAQTD